MSISRVCVYIYICNVCFVFTCVCISIDIEKFVHYTFISNGFEVIDLPE